METSRDAALMRRCARQAEAQDNLGGHTLSLKSDERRRRQGRGASLLRRGAESQMTMLLKSLKNMKTIGKGEAVGEVIGKCSHTMADARDLHQVRGMLMQTGDQCHRLSSRLAGISTLFLRLRSLTLSRCSYPRIPLLILLSVFPVYEWAYMAYRNVVTA